MRTLLYLPLVLILFFASATADAASKAAERAVGGPTAAERASEMASLHADLVGSSPAQVASHHVDLSDEELDILANPGVDDTGLFRVGLAKHAQLQLSAADGDLEIIGPGNTIRLKVQIINGTFHAWDEAGMAHSYTESGWTHSFQAPVRVRASGMAVVTQIGIISLVGEGLCPYNAECVENASCAAIPPEIEAAADAVGHMLFRQGPWWYICSGALVADSDPNTEIPYFLTANHCLSRDNVASTLEVYFDYTIPCGDECGEYDRPDTPRTLGAAVAATNKTGDYTLLKLDDPAPSGSLFLGWNNNPVANSHGAPLYRLSHPGGAPQAYSEHIVDTNKDTCSLWPRGNWIYSHDAFGATEGGSSGSAVLNADGQVVGQLSGACGYNVGEVCDADSNATVDGAFAAYYDEVAAFLGEGDGGGDPGPGGECTDADGDGYCAEVDDCDDTDSHVHPGHQDTRGRWGRDGVDNDCNGIVDG